MIMVLTSREKIKLLFLTLTIYTILIVGGGMALKDNEILRLLYCFLVLVGEGLFTKVYLFRQRIFSALPGAEIRGLKLILISTFMFGASWGIVEAITGNPLYGEISAWLILGWIFIFYFFWIYAFKNIKDNM